MSEVLYTLPDGTVVTSSSIVCDYCSDTGHIPKRVELDDEGNLICMYAACGIYISSEFVVYASWKEAWENGSRMRICDLCSLGDY